MNRSNLTAISVITMLLLFSTDTFAAEKFNCPTYIDAQKVSADIHYSELPERTAIDIESNSYFWLTGASLFDSDPKNRMKLKPYNGDDSQAEEMYWIDLNYNRDGTYLVCNYGTLMVTKRINNIAKCAVKYTTQDDRLSAAFNCE